MSELKNRRYLLMQPLCQLLKDFTHTNSIMFIRVHPV